MWPIADRRNIDQPRRCFKISRIRTCFFVCLALALCVGSTFAGKKDTTRMRRSKPFSGKARKEQLKNKKASKQQQDADSFDYLQHNVRRNQTNQVLGPSHLYENP
eukprot:764831-Hanusia_phi.AAC.6